MRVDAGIPVWFFPDILEEPEGSEKFPNFRALNPFTSTGEDSDSLNLADRLWKGLAFFEVRSFRIWRPGHMIIFDPKHVRPVQGAGIRCLLQRKIDSAIVKQPVAHAIVLEAKHAAL